MPDDIFSEIIECLNAEARQSGGVAYVLPETLKDLGTDFPPPEKNKKISEKSVVSQSNTVAKPAIAATADGSDLGGLAATVMGCTKCPLAKGRRNVVFGEGNPNAKLMFIGEGPGRDEDIQGRPFVGAAGQLLTKMINAMQFEREDVYIANVVKCRPPGNRNPEDPEAEACLPYLRRQIELIKPEVLVLLGAVPLFYLLGKKGITRLHGEWHEYMGIKTLPTFHPAYLLRSPSEKKHAWADLQKVMQLFGKTHPSKNQ